MPKKGGTTKKAASKTAKKTGKAAAGTKATGKKASAKKTNTPRIIVAKGGPTKAALLERVMRTMEEDNWIKKAQGKDFVDSLVAVVEDELGQGHPVNLFGLLKLVPRFHTAGEREVYKVFGDPESGRMMKKYKPKVSLRAVPTKALKDALPTTQKMAKVVGL